MAAKANLPHQSSCLSVVMVKKGNTGKTAYRLLLI